MNHVYKNINELKTDLNTIMTFHDPHLTLHKPEQVTKETIDKLVYTAVFAKDETLKAKTRKIVRALAKEMGVTSSSIRSFYTAMAEGKVKGFTVPAINIRMLTYDVARAIFRTAKEKDAGAFIIEIAKTESEYTDQNPDEFATVILAAAIKEQYSWPVFIQGDHCQFSAWRYAKDNAVEIQRLKDWVTLLYDAGFRNFDIDGSTLVDLSKPSLHAQQKDNAHVTAVMTKYIRDIQNDDIQCVIGGEIGHIGDKNSTVEEFEAFMSQYVNKVPRGSGISKVSAQTGTSHGGVVNPDGTIQKAAVDFSVIKSIGEVARKKYRMAGAVQHGASTLPTESFHKFIAAGAAEIHLSTGFQNLVYDTMPKKLRDEMYSWIKKECKEEWKEGMTEEQFIYKTRKKAWGPFKQQVWGMAEKEKQTVIKAMEEYITLIFDQLGVENTTKDIVKYVK